MVEFVTTTDVPNPDSSGGTGFFFEQHVAAFWLVQLLVRGVPPIFCDSFVRQASFQTRHLGWDTDDFLIECGELSGPSQRLMGQVKRTFLVSAANDECVKTITHFWLDFNKADRFNLDQDRLVLVVQRGSNVLLQHFGGLLGCACAAKNGEDFLHRLSTKGFVSTKVADYYNVVVDILKKQSSEVPSTDQIWKFLRSLHLLVLDLYTVTRQTESQLKTLLIHTMNEDSDNSIAGDVWNELLTFASSAMSSARSIVREDLPKGLLSRFSGKSYDASHAITRLQEHTKPVLRKIRNTLGQSLHIPRDSIVQDVIRELHVAQVVIIAGPAGSGKSAIGKSVVSTLAEEHLVFGFRGVEFAKPHIDQALQSAQIPIDAESLWAILSPQSRKLFLVESVERLLEESTRDAFSDLLDYTASDPTIGILLTCRDYSLEQVRASFLIPAKVEHATVKVPPLTDEELSVVIEKFPTLEIPLGNVSLRDVLRNPYFLDKALKISWPSEENLPSSERQFRQLFWRDIVRTPEGESTGEAFNREQTLHEIAIRRARSLKPYVRSDDLQQDVLASLKRDSLIESSEHHDVMVALAHDVLEDWTILQWLDYQFLILDESPVDMASAIGAHPSIRRSFRQWIGELIESKPEAADRFFLSAIHDSDLTSQFRDDTIVAVLRGNFGPEFISRHNEELLRNDCSILMRVIRLLRVSCVVTRDWLEGSNVFGSMQYVPDGASWLTVLKLVSENLDRFTSDARMLLLGLVEDAVSDVKWNNRLTEEGPHITSIAYWLLNRCGIYEDDVSKRVLKVLAKIPESNPKRFKTLLLETEDFEDRRAFRSEELRRLVLSGLEGSFVASERPELVIEAFKSHVLSSDDDEKPDELFVRSHDIDVHFGLNEHALRFSGRTSGFQGPWIPLLNSHFFMGLDFFVEVFDRSLQCYLTSRMHQEIDPVNEVTIRFSDGNKRPVWCNQRLWNCYRGTSVTPYVLQSMLMGLEFVLLELGDRKPDRLDQILISVLSRTKSCSLVAVVASVATAFPRHSVETLIALLSSPVFFSLDLVRKVQETGVETMMSGFPPFSADEKIYVEERKESNKRPHRQKDLEDAIRELQLTSIAPRVHSIFDSYDEELSNRPSKSESHPAWRLAIQRMDLRTYEISDSPRGVSPSGPSTPSAAHTGYIELTPKPAKPEIQEVFDATKENAARTNRHMRVLMWGVRIFEGNTRDYDSSEWRSMIEVAHEVASEGTDEDLGLQHAPGNVAAVCVRDHFDEMSADERNWCIDTVCAEVTKYADKWNSFEHNIQNYSMASDRPCATVLPILLGRSLSRQRMERVREAFVKALTHPTNQVRWFFLQGMGREFWETNSAIAIRCINAIAFEALVTEQPDHKLLKRGLFRKHTQVLDGAGVAMTVRNAFWKEHLIPDDAYISLDTATRRGAEASARILVLLSKVPHESFALDAFTQASREIVRRWEDRTSHSELSTEADQAISQSLEHYLMNTSYAAARQVLHPILEAIDQHPTEMHYILDGLTLLEDRLPNTDHYWCLWRLFADAVKNATWMNRLDETHTWGQDMLYSIFLTAYWKDDVRHWRSLEGHEEDIHLLFRELPPSSVLLDAYLRFLYHIGERALPEAFVEIWKFLVKDERKDLFRISNTVYILEVLLQRYVYGRPLELKSATELREAVLTILDKLVDAGSSAAFRMRDDFVTPLPENHA